MTNRTEQITQIKAAIKAIEAQRSILGDAAVDLSLKALQLQLQIAELETAPSAFPQSEGERGGLSLRVLWFYRRFCKSTGIWRTSLRAY